MNEKIITDFWLKWKHNGGVLLEEFWVLVQDLLRHLSPVDLLSILFPPMLGMEVARGFFRKEPLADKDFGSGRRDEELVLSVLKMARWMQHNYFSTTISGTHLVPKDYPVMIVGNHNGGLMPLDALFAMNSLMDEGDSRSVYSLVHDFVYLSSKIADMACRMGVLRANPENALDVLNNKAHLLVYPGGDIEAFRSYKDRKKVILAGRKGFIKIALQSKVPIVPLVSVGLHESFFVLTSGRNWAKKIRLKDFIRTEVLPLSLCFPWGLVPAFFPFIPLPTSIEMEFGEPICISGSPDDEFLVQQIYQDVEKQMQQMMDSLCEKRESRLNK
jgi:1-acyl-sn-glycerol-3-phosphate acyltransferase